MMPPREPIASDAPLPHRKVVRAWVAPMAVRTYVRPVLLLLLDYVLLAVALAAAVLADSLLLKVAGGVAAGLITGRLFIIGHDACHQSLTPSRRLNRWLGRIAFLPSLTPYSLWEVGHNVVHHGYTNLKGFDFIWAPMTLEEFRALSGPRRWMERIYRSGWGAGLYYMIEIWWYRMFFPGKAAMPTRRRVFTLDCLLISAYGAAVTGALWWAAVATQQSVALVLAVGALLPFLVWCTLMGLVVYAHHTHVRVHWYDDQMAWAQAQPFISTTVHLTFPWRLGALLHHIMEHTAHHVDMSIPLYRLAAAQRSLEGMLPGRIIIQPFSWRWYRDTARRCKLYDFRTHQWTDFHGIPTT
ncbi:fatty acid desaturase [Bordetella genomosp. 13]|uniref:Fatty acid desaturase n=1 Tax=Bordetella genomosp. 13 TaxID=463040 RepID=A0A1W6Z704_9BORD|nr:fatty acid desaturase [Bordetella genomosp. 13]ARP93032.1 fatty acid desaturase [Bordetella genomosp. 13]